MRTIHVIVDGEGDELDVCDSAETAAAECQNWNVCRELGPYRLVQYITKPGPDYDWPTFWQSLTAQETAAALDAMAEQDGATRSATVERLIRDATR